MDKRATEIFFSFLPEDREFYQQIRQHLSLLEREGRLRCWSSEDILPGATWKREIWQLMERVMIIVPLISPAYLASDLHYDELVYAMERWQIGQVHVVPILLKPGMYQDAPFAPLETLPADGRTLTTPVSSRDERLSEIAAGIEKLLQKNQAIIATKQPLINVCRWNVPYPRNPFFTGREAELRAIEMAFDERSATDPIRTQAISGLGGIGKTQLVLEYAYRHRTQYRYIFWALADTRNTLLAAYNEFANILGLGTDCQCEQSVVISTVNNWMACNQDWLFILDNADDLHLVRDFLPTSPLGHILCTTRAHAMGRLAERIEVKKFSVEEGSHFLLYRSGLLRKDAPFDMLDPTAPAFAKEITQEVDGLPLALDQAGAYIEETNCGLSGYVRLYRAQQAELLGLRGGLVIDHPEPVSTTWQLAFERVEAGNAGAADLLRLCAFLAPDEIPEALLHEGAAELTPSLRQLATHPLLFNAALAVLQSYSLIVRHPTTSTFDIHRLVQAVVRSAMPKQNERIWAERAVRLANRIFPWPEITNLQVCQQFLPHAQTCAAWISSWQLECIEGAHLLGGIGEYFYRRGEYNEAQEYNERMLAITCSVLGGEHQSIPTAYNNVAAVYQAQGKYAEAEEMYRRALALCTRTMESEEVAFSMSLNNLGVLYEAQEKYAEAEVVYQQALAMKRKILGDEHPDTATSLSNLANVYRKQEKYVEAEVAHQQALAMKRKVLGDEHPDTAASLNNLANVYRKQGRYAEAEALYKQALSFYQVTLNVEHPEVATCLSNLGMCYALQENYPDALPLLERALAVYQKTLGSEHSLTKRAKHDREAVFQAQEQRKRWNALLSLFLAQTGTAPPL